MNAPEQSEKIENSAVPHSICDFEVVGPVAKV